MSYFHPQPPAASSQFPLQRHARPPKNFRGGRSPMPLRPVQPVVPQWNHDYNASQQFVPIHGIYYSTRGGPATTQLDPYRARSRDFVHPYQYQGQIQRDAHPQQGGQVSFGGPSQLSGHHYPQFFSPDREKTPTPRDPRPEEQSPRGIQHAWRDRWECPQPSGIYVPPPLPNIDFKMQAEVGDIVRIRPWEDQYTWIEGRVDKLDYAVVTAHQPLPRYVVSYRHPDSGHEVRRLFSPYLSQVTVRATDSIVLERLPDGLDRYLYVCIPPLYTKQDEPLEKIWTKAQVLTPPDQWGAVNIRIIEGPSNNVLFHHFPLKDTLPYTRASRVQVSRQGYALAGRDEHPLEEEYKFNVQ